MTAKNRMPLLLALNDQNPEIANISIRRFDDLLASIGGQTFISANCGKEGYSRMHRTLELNCALDPRKAVIIRHHIGVARRDVDSFIYQVLEDKANGMQANSRFLMEYPDNLYNKRIAPCLEYAELFDLTDLFRRRYNQWRAIYLGKLNHICRAQAPGKGKYKRRFEAFAAVWWELYPTLANLLDDMVAATSGE